MKNLWLLLALKVLLILTGCAKNEAEIEWTDTRATDKTIVEYLEVEPVSEVVHLLDGQSIAYEFSEDGDFTAAGGVKTIMTNMSFVGRISLGGSKFDSENKIILPTKSQMYEFKLYVDDVDQMICTDEQSSSVEVKAYPMFNDMFSQVRVPRNGYRCKVLYDDDTYGYIPDSVSVAAYPIAGRGVVGIEEYMDISPVLIAEITGPWFKVTSNVLDGYTFKDIPADYFEGNGEQLEDRIRYTDRELVQEAFLNVNTTYFYQTKANSDQNIQFTVEVAPNTTGKSRSFTLGFPYQNHINGSCQYKLFKVIQQ